MNYLIIGAPGSGKTTAFTGSDRHNIKGLKAENTLVLTPSQKALPFVAMKKGYNQTSIKDIEFFTKGTLPKYIDKNVINFSTAAFNGPNGIDILLKYVELARKIGLTDKKHKLKNVVVDDIQHFINDRYFAAKGNGFEAAKESGMYTIRLISYFKKLELESKTSLEAMKNRIDVFIFMHGEPLNSSEKIGKKNPVLTHTAGNITKTKYAIQGDFNNIMYIDNHKFITKSREGLEFIKIEEGILPENSGYIAADLATLRNSVDTEIAKLKTN